MNCHNCNTPLKSTNAICPNCGMNDELYEKLFNLSNAFYNKGLRQAKMGELSSAKESLLKSIGYYKKNIDARNLLGLICHEIGLLGDALKHWVISVSVQKDNNVANSYLEIYQRNTSRIERTSDSLRMYNKALGYIQQNSEDMAIIQLKKAIEYNDHFVEAMNLLALCYMIVKDNSRAVSLVEKVLSIDVGNPAAIYYYKSLNKGKIKALPIAKQSSAYSLPQKKTIGTSSFSSNEFSGFPGRIPLSELICLITGAVAALAIMYFLVLPSNIEKKNEEIAAIQDGFTVVEENHQNELKLKDQEISNLINEKEVIKSEKNALESQIEIQQRVQKAQTAYNYYSEQKYEEAIAVLNSLDTESLPSDTIEIINTVKEESYRKLGEANFENGKVKYNNANYPESKIDFENALKYVLPNSEYVGDTYYFLARIAEIDDDIDQALIYFQKVVDEFPDALNYNRAVNKVKNLSR